QDDDCGRVSRENEAPDRGGWQADLRSREILRGAIPHHWIFQGAGDDMSFNIGDVIRPRKDPGSAAYLVTRCLGDGSLSAYSLGPGAGNGQDVLLDGGGNGKSASFSIAGTELSLSLGSVAGFECVGSVGRKSLEKVLRGRIKGQ